MYTVTVADLANTPADQPNAIDDAVSLVRKTGDIKLDVNARINREFGRELSRSPAPRALSRYLHVSMR